MPENRRRTGDGGVPGGEAHRWKPGQSGNPGGRPKTAALSQACRAVLDKIVPGDREKRTYAQAIAERLADLAVKGHLGAVRELGDRTEGRVGLALPAPKSLPESLIEEMLDPSKADSESEGSTERHEVDEDPQSREGVLESGPRKLQARGDRLLQRFPAQPGSKLKGV